MFVLNSYHMSQSQLYHIAFMFQRTSWILRLWFVNTKIGLCRRRRWSDPHYECYKYTHGFGCAVRVNGRDYVTDATHQTEALAKEAGAQLAYQYSVNESQFFKMVGITPQAVFANGTVV